jgi:hypothetical protein
MHTPTHKGTTAVVDTIRQLVAIGASGRKFLRRGFAPLTGFDERGAVGGDAGCDGGGREEGAKAAQRDRAMSGKEGFRRLPSCRWSIVRFGREPVEITSGEVFRVEVDCELKPTRHITAATACRSVKAPGRNPRCRRNQVAMKDPTVVPATLERLMQEGLNRHDAIHAIGSDFIQIFYDKTTGNKHPDINAEYCRQIAILTAESWGLQ